MTSRTTLVLNEKLSTLGKYGVEPGQKVNRETGLFATVNYNNTIAPNVTYRGRADFFSNYYNQPENINLFMTNLFTFKILKNFVPCLSCSIIFSISLRAASPPCREVSWKAWQAGYAYRDIASATTLSFPGIY